MNDLIKKKILAVEMMHTTSPLWNCWIRYRIKTGFVQ